MVDSFYLVAYSFHFLADSFFTTSPPCRIYESAIIINESAIIFYESVIQKNEYTTCFDECASVLCRGFIINGGGLLEKPALFIFWWRNSSLFLGLRPMLCCCVLLRQVWSCVALSSMSSGLILSCRVLCGLVLFCLRCFSTQTLCPELLSSISIWVVRMAEPQETVPLDGGSTIAPSNRSHLCHVFPYIAHPLSFIQALTSPFIFMSYSQPSHRPRNGLVQTKTLLFSPWHTTAKMDLCLIFEQCLARHEYGICHHGQWRDHDGLSSRY